MVQFNKDFPKLYILCFFFNSVIFVFQTLFQDLFLVMANYTHNAFTEYLLMYSVCVQMYYKNPVFHKLALRVFLKP